MSLRFMIHTETSHQLPFSGYCTVREVPFKFEVTNQSHMLTLWLLLVNRANMFSSENASQSLKKQKKLKLKAVAFAGQQGASISAKECCQDTASC